MRVDLHSHSNCSDGLDQPAALARRMAAAGLGAFALTDHDTLQGLPDARDEARRLGIELISGAEISAARSYPIREHQFDRQPHFAPQTNTTRSDSRRRRRET